MKLYLLQSLRSQETQRTRLSFLAQGSLFERKLSVSASSAARETLTAAAPVNCGSVDQGPAYSQESWLEKDLEFTIYNLQYMICNLWLSDQHATKRWPETEDLLMIFQEGEGSK